LSVSDMNRTTQDRYGQSKFACATGMKSIFGAYGKAKVG
jgi:hypothetical protein